MKTTLRIDGKWQFKQDKEGTSDMTIFINMYIYGN